MLENRVSERNPYPNVSMDCEPEPDRCASRRLYLDPPLGGKKVPDPVKVPD